MSNSISSRKLRSSAVTCASAAGALAILLSSGRAGAVIPAPTEMNVCLSSPPIPVICEDGSVPDLTDPTRGPGGCPFGPLSSELSELVLHLSLVDGGGNHVAFAAAEVGDVVFLEEDEHFVAPLVPCTPAEKNAAKAAPVNTDGTLNRCVSDFVRFINNATGDQGEIYFVSDGATAADVSAVPPLPPGAKAPEFIQEFAAIPPAVGNAKNYAQTFRFFASPPKTCPTTGRLYARLASDTATNPRSLVSDSIVAVAQVPALSTYGVIGMCLMLIGMGTVFAIRRRSAGGSRLVG